MSRFGKSVLTLKVLLLLAGLVVVVGRNSHGTCSVGQAPGGRVAYLFLSANAEDGLSLDDALRRLASERQRDFRQLAEEILAEVGGEGASSRDAIGDWAGGVENSILVTVPGGLNRHALRYAAARFGLAAGQNCVLVFRAHHAGPDRVYELEIAETRVVEIRTLLNRHAIGCRTIVPSENGHRVLVFDEVGRLRAAFERLAGSSGINISVTAGYGEYLGKDTREEAGRHFRDIVRRYESTRDRAEAPARALPAKP